MADHEERLHKKQQFYEGLDSSTKSDDEQPDEGRQSSLRAMQKATARKQQAAATKKNSGREKKTLPRSVSDSRISENLKKNRPVPTLTTRHTMPGLSGTLVARTAPPSAPKTIGKRKRSVGVDQVPDDQQIFRGLRFYFFPNSDKNPARKIRIAKASGFGATWEKDYNDSVTHVIVDKATQFGQLTKFIKLDSLPPHVVVVSEDYPAECITYRALLNPLQLQFKVKGYENKPTTRPSSSGSDTSLALKPAGKSVIARVPETQTTSKRASTPPPAAESSDSDIGGAQAHDSKLNRFLNVQSSVEFDEAIRQARELQDVPLDNDDEPVSRPSSSEGPDTDDETPAPGLKHLKQSKSKYQSFEDRFQCMQKHTGSKTETANAGTIAILQQMADYYGQIGDDWRLRAYRKAISVLRNHPIKVWTKEEAARLPQIGERLAAKIEEIAYTNRLRRLENAKAEPSDQVLQDFMKIYGVGYAQASKWVNAGYTTIDALLEKAELSENQRIGIDHYEDFNSRIPRSEVEQHGNIVRKTLQKIDPAFEIIVGGSYRRGAETSSDIDCIVTRPETGLAHIRQVVLEQLVPQLSAKKFLVAELAATSRDDGSKWHGASQLSSKSDVMQNPWRRIDLLLVPSDELGAALIYFTGNDIFNRSMRLLAGTKGMRLNQRGLYKDVIRGKGREKLSEGTLVEGRDEKKIFEILGVPWRPPEHRVIC